MIANAGELSKPRVLRRLLASMGAGLAAQGVTILLQLVSVPLLLAAWGQYRYGEWLILSAIPAFLVMSDIGFSTAAGTSMTMKVAAGDRGGALNVLKSTWVLVMSLSLLAGLLASVLAWAIPPESLGIQTLRRQEVAMALCILLGHVIVGLQNAVLLAGFRCDGHYAAGVLASNLQRLTEAIALVGVAFVSNSMIDAAMAYLVGRSIGLVGARIWLSRRSPWLRLSDGRFQWQIVRELTQPAISIMGFSLAQAVSVQGVITVIGNLLGPAAVIVFSLHRTIANVLFQSLGLIYNSMLPEISAAFGADDLGLARSLHRRGCQFALWLGAGASVFLAMTGEGLLKYWTGGKVAFHGAVYAALLLTSFFKGIWYTSSIVPIATNRPREMALLYAITSSGSLVVAWFLGRHLGLPGVGWSLLAGDLVMTVLVVRIANVTLQEDRGTFLRVVMRPPALSTLARWRGN